MSNELKLSLSQISKMKHAIGLNNINQRPKDGNFSAYRNFYSCREEDKEWEELVIAGQATCQYVNWNQEYVYHVSQEGLDYLGKIFNIKIKEMK